MVDIRSRKGWTHEKLAEKARVSVRTIQNVEQGKPTLIGTILKLAQALGIQARDCMLASDAQLDSPSVRSAVSIARDSFSAPPCPYRGLLPFREEDSEFFFGREHLLQVLQETLLHRNVVQVSGPSGSGKSSLVAAGLIAALRKSKSWQVLRCRPGMDPFNSMAAVLLPHLQPDLDETARAAQLPKLSLALQDGQLGYVLHHILAIQENGCFLLFIDQFEELYTHCNRQETRQRFLDSLLALMSASRFAGQSGVKLVYALRADFMHRLLSHRGFTDAIQGGDVKIGPMTREELDCVIRKPALHYGVRFEDGLAERILNDAGREPSSLPLLEFTLTELWESQKDRVLTHIAYEQIGQLSGAIANRAETVYRSLPSSQQDATQLILTRLVRLAEEGGEDTRQRIPVTALYAQEQLNTDHGRMAVEVLTDARLVTVGLGDDLRQETVEIAHEALIRRWPRLSQWLRRNRRSPSAFKIRINRL
ncbi:MAG: AAA family ATPase [Bryobacteraceae bacterium]